jgi:hypothetical protein
MAIAVRDAAPRPALHSLAWNGLFQLFRAQHSTLNGLSSLLTHFCQFSWVGLQGSSCQGVP